MGSSSSYDIHVSSSSQIQLLVEAYPAAVTQQDRLGKNPLHHLMAHHAKCVLSVQVYSVFIGFRVQGSG
jgi:hypothetical protein